MNAPDEGRISDAELLEREFVARDPELLPGLIRSLPDDHVNAEIEYWYDVSPPKGQERAFVWCAHDGRETHWKGYVMKAPSGVRFLMGKDCGKKIFGHDFERIARGFSELRTRQRNLHRHRAVAAAIPGAMDEMADILSDPVLREYDLLRSQLRTRTPELYRALVWVVARRDGSLTVEERVRDRAAELRRAERHGAEDSELERAREKKERGLMTLTAFKRVQKAMRQQQKARDDDAIYTIIEKQVGVVFGRDLFLPDASPGELLRKAFRDMRALRTEVSTPTQSTTNRSLQAVLRGLRDCVSKVEAQLERLRAPHEFFAARNLATVARWASQVPRGRGPYRSQGSSIVWESAHEDVTVAFSASYKVPGAPRLEILKLALTNSASGS